MESVCLTQLPCSIDFQCREVQIQYNFVASMFRRACTEHWFLCLLTSFTHCRNLLQLHHVHGGQQRGHNHHDPQLSSPASRHTRDARLGQYYLNLIINFTVLQCTIIRNLIILSRSTRVILDSQNIPFSSTSRAFASAPDPVVCGLNTQYNYTYLSMFRPPVNGIK